MRSIHLSRRAASVTESYLAANGTGSRIQAPMGHVRNGAEPKNRGVSEDTRMALEDDDDGR